MGAAIRRTNYVSEVETVIPHPKSEEERELANDLICCADGMVPRLKSPLRHSCHRTLRWLSTRGRALGAQGTWGEERGLDSPVPVHTPLRSGCYLCPL